MPAVHIPGRPVPKQRARRSSSGRAYIPRETRDYEQAVAGVVRAARAPVSGSADVDIVVRVAGRAGDVDNYAKSLLDGLVKGGGIGDDRDVVHLSVRLERVGKGQESASIVWQASAAVRAA